MNDTAEPRNAVAALYDALSGPPGRDRDWGRLRSLFLPDAHLRIVVESNGAEQIGDWTVEAFIEHARQLYVEQGFWEHELTNRIDTFGNIAHVFSTYETRIGEETSEPVARGVNSIQLLRLGGRWWITAIVFHVEEPGAPIPARYLP
jgi:hypothetical protein